MTVPAKLDARFRDAASAAGLLDAAYDVTDSPIGELLVAATDRGVCWIEFGPEETLDRLQRQVGTRLLRVPRRLTPVRRELDEYFSGDRTTLRRRRRPRGGARRSSGTCWTSSCASRTAR